MRNALKKKNFHTRVVTIKWKSKHNNQAGGIKEKKGKESGNMVLLMNGEVNGNCWASRIAVNGKDEDRVYISDQLF